MLKYSLCKFSIILCDVAFVYDNGVPVIILYITYVYLRGKRVHKVTVVIKIISIILFYKF
jgi:hypothetical protein